MILVYSANSKCNIPGGHLPLQPQMGHSHYNIKLSTNTPKARQYRMPPCWGCTISLFL